MPAPDPHDPSRSPRVEQAPKVNETLSQFAAKVLDQLSLSAWLPSAALVLSVLALNLAASKESFGEAITAIAGFGLSEGFFVFASVVVLTMITQAFEFEAIRLLEGYWGTNRMAERLADACCWYQTLLRERHRRRRHRLRVCAFEKARTALVIKNDDRAKSRFPPLATERDLEVIEAKILKLNVTSTAEERESARSVPWQEHAPAGLARRVENLDQRLKEFPVDNRVLPTRLGNVLRAYEDVAFPGTAPLEGSVQRIFHTLPITLQSEHDQHRTRLNLYCSMVVVAVVLTVFAIARLSSMPWSYPTGAVLGGFSVTWLFYRAAIASARAYGGVLETIRTYQEEVRRSPQPASTSSSLR